MLMNSSHQDRSSMAHLRAPEGMQLIDQIRYLGERLNATQNHFPTFHRYMRELERLLLLRRVDQHEADKAVTEFTAAEMANFQNLYCSWETQLESRFVDFLCRGICGHFADYALYARFERLIDREVRLLNGYEPRKVLFIGSGPMPITAICLENRINAPIDCLEMRAEAITESQRLLKELELQDRITVLHGEGQQYTMADYDMILVALLAKPKKDILANIADNCSSNTRIICRTSEGARCFFYEPTDDSAIPRDLKIVDRTYAGIDDTISSCLIRKVKA